MIESMRTLKVSMDYAMGRQRPASASWPPFVLQGSRACEFYRTATCLPPCAAATPWALGGAGRGAMGLGTGGNGSTRAADACASSPVGRPPLTGGGAQGRSRAVRDAMQQVGPHTRDARDKARAALTGRPASRRTRLLRQRR